MDRLENILNICFLYKNGKYSMEEFQSRLGTALWPEPETEIAHRLRTLIDMEDAGAELELAIYFYGEEKAIEVADRIINAIHSVQ